MGLTITAIVCAYNEARLLPACLYSLRAQTRPPDEILVINNASTDDTRAAAQAVPGVIVVDEPLKGLVVARETARRVAHGDIVAYVDADCRAPIMWLERCQQRLQAEASLFVEDAPPVREELGCDRACASGERRRRVDVVSQRLVGRVRPGHFCVTVR
jgi:glycosyltransferase involved in cell wall biosynthesis